MERLGILVLSQPNFEAKEFDELLHVGPSGAPKLTGAIPRALRPAPPRGQAAANAA